MEAIDSVTRQAALAVLDAYWMQQKVLASNIANHATPGYKAHTVDFDGYLTSLESAMNSRATGADENAIERLALPTIRVTDADVQLDSQAAEIAKNSLQYQAVLTAVSRLQSLNRVAVTGGAQ